MVFLANAMGDTTKDTLICINLNFIFQLQFALNILL